MKTFMVLVFLFFQVQLFSQELSSVDQALIKDAGIPLYPNAEFANGNNQVGYRFITNEKVADVQKWFKEQLPDWSLYSEYGGWILYKGEPGAGVSDLMMKKNQVSVQYNENLPQWFSLDKDMTTEIVIGIFE